MDELWQLYNEDQQPLKGKGAGRDDVFGKGLLHGASHIWIWRNNNDVREILVQKRANTKRTWPDRFDISAAGHIDLGEDPVIAALREAKEEIDVTISPEGLQEIFVNRVRMTAPNGAIENEHQWVYVYELPAHIVFALQKAEVASLIWKSLDDFAKESGTDAYVPHGKDYYQKVIAAIRA